MHHLRHGERRSRSTSRSCASDLAGDNVSNTIDFSKNFASCSWKLKRSRKGRCVVTVVTVPGQRLVRVTTLQDGVADRTPSITDTPFSAAVAASASRQ